VTKIRSHSGWAIALIATAAIWLRPSQAARPPAKVALPAAPEIAASSPSNESVVSGPASVAAVAEPSPTPAVIRPRAHAIHAAKLLTPALAVQVDAVGELELLMRARRVVKANPARALDLADEHASQFPDGAFGQEREVIAIDALARLGRIDAAAARADRFRQSHPGSAYIARIDEILRRR
jgi:hypothetical protein